MNKRPAGEILILTGPPGAGKSSVANLLASGSTDPAVHLRADDFWRSIKKGCIPPYLPEANLQNKVVIEALASAARRYAIGNYFVVVDGIVGPWFLKPFQKIASELPLHYVVLRPNVAVALKRAQGRAGDVLRDATPIRDLYQQFVDLKDLESHVLDTTFQTVSESVAAVTAAVSGERFQLRKGHSI